MKKRTKTIVLLCTILIVLIAIIAVLDTKTTIFSNIKASFESAEAGTSTITYYHLDLRVDTNYELPASGGYSKVTGIADINTISVTDSEGTTIAIEMDSETSADENDGSTEYKSVKGHGGPNGESLSLTEGDYVTISLNFTYEDYEGNEVTEAVNAVITLNEDTNECSGNSGNTYGYDFTIYVQDYINAVVSSVDTIYGYTIYYYYDGNIDTTETITGSAALDATVEYTEKDKDGAYTLDSGKTGDTSMTITSTVTDNVLNIYYVSATTPTYSYTINYYYDGQQDDNETITGYSTEGQTITYTEKTKNGAYELDKDETEATTMTISSTEDNVLNIYYKSVSTATPTYSYTINYYYDGTQDTNETITDTAEEGVKITYTEKTKNGAYELDESKTEATSMTISSTEDNVLNIYYKSVSTATPTYSYTINYYYDGTQDTNETITDTAEEGVKIIYTEKTKNGAYELDESKTEATSMTISSTEDNVLNIYYKSVSTTTPTYSYTIYYYYDNELDLNETITDTVEEGVKITYTEKTKDGAYELDESKTEATSMTISSTEDNVLNIYYKSVSTTTPTYSYTIYYYYDKVLDADETITDTAEEGEEITYTEKTKNGTYELDEDSTEKTKVTISSTESENVLNIYYKSVAGTEEGTIIVKYMDISTSTEIADEETITGTVGTNYETEQKEIEGYTYASVSGDATGTIGEGTTTVIYYYTEDEDESVTNTVKYVDDDTETTTNSTNATANTVTSLPYTGGSIAGIILCVCGCIVGITAFLKLSIYKDEH